MGYLTRDAILAVDDTQAENVAVPEWGGTVRVRGMSGTQRDAFEASVSEETPAGTKAQRRAGATTTKVKKDLLRARLCAWCIVDEAGQRVFSEEDMPALNAKSGAALERVMNVAMRLSGMTDNDVEDLAEEMIENPFDGSNTP